jgi:hypothetical protein
MLGRNSLIMRQYLPTVETEVTVTDVSLGLSNSTQLLIQDTSSPDLPGFDPRMGTTHVIILVFALAREQSVADIRELWGSLDIQESRIPAILVGTEWYVAGVSPSNLSVTRDASKGESLAKDLGIPLFIVSQEPQIVTDIFRTAVNLVHESKQQRSDAEAIEEQRKDILRQQLEQREIPKRSGYWEWLGNSFIVIYIWTFKNSIEKLFGIAGRDIDDVV